MATTDAQSIYARRTLSSSRYFLIGIGLLIITGILDVWRPFDRSWSILYILVALYAGWFLRGRIELALLAMVLVSAFLVPLAFSPEMAASNTGLFYRATGVLASMVTIGLMWDRRMAIAALQEANARLETKVAARTSDLETANETLRHEIAERLKSEESLQKISQFRETLIRTAAEGISVCYPIRDFPFVAFSVWNERMSEITGYTMEEINRLGWYQSLYPDLELRKDAIDRMNRMRNYDDLHAEEWEIVRKDGERRTLAISTSVVEIELGVNGVVALMQDITERKQADEMMQMMRVSIDRSSGSVFWVDRQGRILYTNDGASRDLGYTRDEMLTMTIFDLDVEPDYQPGKWEQHFDDLKRRGTITLETRHRAKDGRIFPIEVLANFVQIGDKEFNFSFVRDITQRKQNEANLQASRQRLETLSRTLLTTQESERRHLARELHDEIGQTLTAIKISLRRTQRSTDEITRTLLDENVKMVDQAIVQVRNLSVNLRPPQLDELGLAAALHWLLKQQSGIGGFEEELTIDIDKQAIPKELEVVCFRIVQEALTNAVRHGKPNKVSVNLQIRVNELRLSIHDDGVGFDIGDTRERTLNGDSFGLAGMQERASLAGGKAEIDSTEGQGTTVRAWFPLAPS